MLPPTSAGIGGGSGTVELAGADEVCGAVDVGLGVAEGEPDVVGAELLDVVGEALAEVLDLVVAEVDVAGDCGPWKSVQVSVRMVLPPMLTLRDFAVTV